jgi:hypothetical protein
VPVPVKEKHCERQKLSIRIQTSIDKEEDLSIIRIPVQRRKAKTKSTGTKKRSIDTGTYRYKNKLGGQETKIRIRNILVLDQTYLRISVQNQPHNVLADPESQGSSLTTGSGSANLRHTLP